MQFQKNEQIANYTVLFPHKQGSYAETYRVKDNNGRILFLKLISFAKLNSSQYNIDGSVIELSVSRLLNHANVCSYVDDGIIVSKGQQYVYIVTEFVSGETVSEKMVREGTISVYDTKKIIKSVLRALKFVHSQKSPIIHNEVTPQNTMLNLVDGLDSAKLIDYGHARFLEQTPSKEDLKNINPFYLAPERFNGVCCVQSDLYSVGVMMYHMLFGIVPWYVDLSKFKPEDSLKVLQEKRCSELPIPDLNLFELDNQLIYTIAKAVSPDVNERFQTADEFIQAIDGELKLSAPKQEVETKPKTNLIRKKGNGFKDVAGMSELKEQLQSDVIDILKDPENAKSLGIHIPNGILFFGPPGCGKTFFAEKFAEEIGCNYRYICCSDVASPYIHGGQEKIAAIFDEARENAPTILFLDEVEAMIMNRSKHSNVSEQGEVNEFLSQLNNCGESGVMVIAASNIPSLIDPAALRAGRLELKYYIPQPDYETRKVMFEIGLKNRKVDFGIDYDKLANLTENRVSSDIRLIIDNAARIVFRNKLDSINQLVLEEAILQTKPTVSIDEIHMHEKIRDEFMGTHMERKRIGFM